MTARGLSPGEQLRHLSEPLGIAIQPLADELDHVDWQGANLNQ